MRSSRCLDVSLQVPVLEKEGQAGIRQDPVRHSSALKSSAWYQSVRGHVLVLCPSGTFSPPLPAGLQAADVREALQLLGKVIFVQDRVSSVLHHLKRHCSEDGSELVDALGPVWFREKEGG